ncbi:MAG TPA: hypothetical protein VKB19_12040 [Pedobacter sp.]|nr:hypothetical protein [Pedobacter sp.]
MKTFNHSRYLASVIKTDIQTTYNYRLKVKHRLSEVFSVIPSNAIINKGRCGIGGTYLEIKAQRNSIIVVPTNAIIESKCFDSKRKLKAGYYVVNGRHKTFKYNALRDFMKSDVENKKIFCTPESLSKIVKCGIEPELIYRDWFLLFDEAHTPITDSYRKNIIKGFKYFFSFHNKTLISATPYQFSDPRFDNFDVYNVRFRGYVNRVKVINTNAVESVLHSHLLRPDSYPGRVHIFLNSVTEIANTIRRTEIENYSIFCKEDKNNLEKLDELHHHFKDLPCEASFSKFNFYTSKYFEGWDLFDANATIIIVSDITNPTLKIGVSNKCVQASGRNREYSSQIIHITNSRDILEFRSFAEIANEFRLKYQSSISKYNEHLIELKSEGLAHDDTFRKYAERYADIDKNTLTAHINRFKIDQFVNAEFCNQQFNHKQYVVKAWQEAGFKVTPEDAYLPTLPSDIQRRKGANRIKAVAEFMEACELGYIGLSQYCMDKLNSLPIETADIVEAYQEIGGAKMKELGYYPKFINEAVIEAQNLKNMELVKDEYFQSFGTSHQLTRDINTFLNVHYQRHRIRNAKTGMTKTAKAKDFMSKFTVVDTWRAGTLNGYYVIIK